MSTVPSLVFSASVKALVSAFASYAVLISAFSRFTVALNVASSASSINVLP